MALKITEKLRADGISLAVVISYLILVSACFLFFNQGDIIHTIGCSFALLNGHFKDFYDFNTPTFGEINYLPSTYFLFALWGIPLKLIGKAPPLTYVSVETILWFKLLTSAFFFGSAYVLYKILKLIQSQLKVSSEVGTWLWITSPVAIFSQFIFGQYDIITVFFTLLGLFFWIQGRLYRFSAVFGIALTFKYFPFFIYFPFLFLIEKRPSILIRHGFLLALPVIMELLMFWHSPAFHRGVLGFQAAGRVASAVVTIGSTEFNLLYFIVVLSSLIAFLFPQPKDHVSGFKTALRVAAFNCFASFCCFLWHPQWILFLTPLMALLMLTSCNIGKLLWVDLLFSCAFFSFTVRKYAQIVDQRLWSLGLLRSLNPHPWSESDPMQRLIIFRGVTESGWIAVFNACLLCFLAANLLRSISTQSNEVESVSEVIRINQYRFYIGLSFFIVPAIYCFIASATAR